MMQNQNKNTLAREGSGKGLLEDGDQRLTGDGWCQNAVLRPEQSTEESFSRIPIDLAPCKVIDQ